ncbi:MAG: AbrB/MazE/SpoVT family DNA-binding domain-containing protein [Thermaerobacter sp.]|nr:AbrB/MazE/SpoVT family DNA-binding domain-containing protein [Thermaerobacter sp.]
MTTVHVGPNGHVVVPKALREALSIGPGDSMMVAAHDGTVVLMPVV